MRFRRLHVPAYGPFTGLELDFPRGGADLHLIYGRNEAGKSSLLRAIRDLLYGIHARTSDNFLHDYRNLRIGAELENRAGQRLALQRRKGVSNTLLDAAGNPLADAALAPFLGAVDREFFTTMFGLGAEELRQGAHDLLQGKGDLGQALFSASLAGTPVHRVLGTLDAEARALFDGKAWKNVSIRPALDTFDSELRASRQALVRPEDWEASLRELALAEEAKAALDQALHQRRGRQDWLRRCLDALPALGQLTEAQSRLRGLPSLPDLPAGFPDAATAARHALVAAEARLEELRRRVAELSGRLESLAPRADLLEKAAEIDALAADLALYRQEREALAAERAEAARMRSGLAASLLDLGERADADLGALRVPLEEQLALRAAASRLTEAEDDVAAQQREAARLAEDMEKTARQLATLPSAEVDPLRAAHAASSAAAARVDKGADLAGLARRMASQQRLLPGAPADPDAVQALPLPALARLREFARSASELAGRARQLQEADKEAARLQDALRARLQRLEQRGTLPTQDALVQARARRDADWQQILACWRGAAPEPVREGVPLSLAFQEAVRAADVLADRLRAEADAIAQAEEWRGALREAEAAARRRQEEQRSLEQESQAWQVAWHALWEASGLTPASPEEMLEWRDHWQEFRARHEAWREAREAAAELAAAQEAAAARLRPLLGAEEGGLPELRDLAERRLRNADQALGERRALASRLTELRLQGEALARRQPLLDAALESARACWRALPLGGEQRPEHALRLLEARVDLVARHDVWSRLTAVIEERQRARDAYEARVAACAGAVGIAPAVLAEVRVNALVEALAEARELRARRELVEEDLARLVPGLPEAESQAASARLALETLLQRAGVGDAAALQALLAEIGARQTLAAECERLRASLHAQARGEPLEDFIDRVRAEDGAALAAELADLDEQIHAFESRREQAIQAEARASDAKAGLASSGDSAAEHLQAARHAAARIRQDAGRYLRLRLASRFLREQIESFRARNQGPLLARAGELFQALTGASFSGLGTAYAEDDSPILVGIRAGSNVMLEGMSEGTRDQLYLALRLAAIERHQASHEPMPLILDDLLITFDDDRCRAILPLLRELAGRTQVLLFTHHRHLVELARAALPGDALCLHRLDGTAV